MSKWLLLDRDGVLNLDNPSYVHKVKDYQFVDGAIPALKRLTDAGFKIIIITNQSGIARGMYSKQNFQMLSKYITSELKKAGVAIRATYHCPHHPDITGDCDCRKPKPGMILKAFRDLKINLEKDEVWLIGDTDRDIEAANNASLHIQTIKTKTQGREPDASKIKPQAENLADAINIILNA
ncbi:MAG: HAD family hydrolase [bacterium]